MPVFELYLLHTKLFLSPLTDVIYSYFKFNSPSFQSACTLFQVFLLIFPE